ncbi:SDR family oxidoreductase [Psychrosphaera sp. B3R10]|uniref:SDR family oxidoreductase n=1 Tax=unclassified Psychrosphaera TaxID=2641570 RepID=UPI001C0A5212|nr:MULTISPECIES: SDR family oxidoreductase [unclassified Psychrosphaera]MBU2881852.1 SDR family oxidoreductase [Psychrosphaera sp. I2R16]MBU2989873.1 SDR family oxidoreductase [Psychrosphaera sp. B3R10]MDO6720951.1 SDR family oxidoreductase [Psychrosphaera sp. 1_MG-2023]
MTKVALAGSTGYLGSYIARELTSQGYWTRLLVRNKAKLTSLAISSNEVVTLDVTESEELDGALDGIDVVITTIGITKQRDGQTYYDVDYQANLNILLEAKKSGVKKFIYVSALNGEKLTELKICEAKEAFVAVLQQSGLDYCVIRPNGFFSDLGEFHKMAQQGRVYLFKDGKQKTNPIHGADLAKVCVSAISASEQDVLVGGPDILTHNEIATMAFNAVGKPIKISYVPEWMRRSILGFIRLALSSKTYGPIEFFLTVLSMDMVAPKTGEHHLDDYYTNLSK